MQSFQFKDGLKLNCVIFSFSASSVINQHNSVDGLEMRKDSLKWRGGMFLKILHTEIAFVQMHQRMLIRFTKPLGLYSRTSYDIS